MSRGRGRLGDDVRQVARGWRWTRQPLIPRTAAPWALPPRDHEPRTAWARSAAAGHVRELLQTGVLKPLVWMETRPQVEGLDHLDAVKGPVVFASNHSSHLDAPLILCSLPRRLRQKTVVGAASDYFFDVWWRSAGTALVFNAFAVDRSGGHRAADDARQLAEDGWSILLFPEGTRSKDGWMQRFRQGTAHICIDLGIPAVPVAIRGSYAAMPRGRGWPKPGRQRVSVRYGRPVVPEPGEPRHAFTIRLQHAISRLWDEDASTWWDSLRRESDGATPTPSGPQAPSWRRIWEADRGIDDSTPRRVWQ